MRAPTAGTHVQAREAGDQAPGGLLHRRDVHGAGEGVVAALAQVHVVVGVHGARPGEQLAGPVVRGFRRGSGSLKGCLKGLKVFHGSARSFMIV